MWQNWEEDIVVVYCDTMLEGWALQTQSWRPFLRGLVRVLPLMAGQGRANLLIYWVPHLGPPPLGAGLIGRGHVRPAALPDTASGPDSNVTSQGRRLPHVGIPHPPTPINPAASAFRSRSRPAGRSIGKPWPPPSATPYFVPGGADKPVDKVCVSRCPGGF